MSHLGAGDFQYAIDPRSDDFMRRGVFSCYRPVADSTPMPAAQKELSDTDWAALLHLAHTDASAAFERYAGYYLSTSGQVYWSDTHQLSTYLDGYHRALDGRLGGPPATETITEIYVPRPRLADFFAEVAEAFRTNGVRIVYGTVRLIERDTETFLPWAREPWACTILNLHVEHTPAGVEKAADAFRALILGGGTLHDALSSSTIRSSNAAPVPGFEPHPCDIFGEDRGDRTMGKTDIGGDQQGVVLKEDGKLVEFPSVAEAFSYLRPRAADQPPRPCTVYGDNKDFLRLRYRLIEVLDGVIERESNVASRWMSEATTWGDYFEAKEARGGASSRYDTEATWLTYGGTIT